MKLQNCLDLSDKLPYPPRMRMSEQDLFKAIGYSEALEIVHFNRPSNKPFEIHRQGCSPPIREDEVIVRTYVIDFLRTSLNGFYAVNNNYAYNVPLYFSNDLEFMKESFLDYVLIRESNNLKSLSTQSRGV